MTDLVNCTITDGIALVELNRPEKRNALSNELIVRLNKVLIDLEQDSALRVVILGGSGPSFCAGMDLQGVLDDAQAMAGMLMGFSEAMRRLRRLPVPVIARVQGAAIGGGCGLCVVADFAITHPEARLGYPEVSLGVSPAVVAPWLIKRIGAGPAREMLLSGGTMNGEDALHRGLVSSVCALDELEESALALAQKLTSGGQHAIAVTKQWLNELDGSMEDAPCIRAAELSAEVITSEEARQRLKAVMKP
jgi:methylglutaconyl-CoA hydratase